MARNEIVPIDAVRSSSGGGVGPARGTVPHKPAGKKSNGNFTNAEAMSSQERRIQLVAAQKRHSNFQLFYAMFGLALMVVQMEYLWFANAKELASPCPVHASDQCPHCRDSLANSSDVPLQDGRMILHALRVLISFSTAILLYYIYRYYAAECEVMKIKNIVPPQATLLSSSLRKNLLLELLVLCIHPFPGLESVDPRWPNMVLATSLLMFFRVGLILRAVQSRNSFNSRNGWFIGSLTNIDFSIAFFLKSTLKNHPRRFLLVCAALLLGVAGYSLYVVERFLCAFVADSCCEPMAFADSMWTLIMTVLTIGYGDIVPHTNPGRFFAALTGTCGTLFMAVTIAVMSNQLVLTRSEHKVNAFLKKDDNRRLINDHAARSIQAFVQLIGTQRRHHHGLNSKRGRAAIRRSEMKLFAVLQAYRQVKRHVNSHDVSDPMDKQMTMLEMMEVNVEYIRTKIEDLSELFHSQSGRRSSNLQLAINSATQQQQQQQSTPTSTIPTTSVLATVSVIAQQQIKEQQQQELAKSSSNRTSSVPILLGEGAGLNHSDKSMRNLNGASASQAALNGSNTQKGATSPPSAQTASSSISTPTSAGASSPTERPLMAMLHSRDSSRNLRSESDEMPEWAILLEATLQTILAQVGRVSSDVEAIKTRVGEHIDDVEARMSEIEKKLTVQNAFREITRTASKSGLFKRDSFGASNGVTGSGEPPTISSSEPPTISSSASNSIGGNGLQAVSLQRGHSRRTSIDQRRPSIRNFLTQKDLEEF
ncbi:hypothetical protein Gpo141_00000296 [Globisporangium polare]